MPAPTIMRQDVYTDKAAAPLQHVFSQAILTGKKIYCSGSIGLSKQTGQLVEGGIQAETVIYISSISPLHPLPLSNINRLKDSRPTTLTTVDSQERILDNLEAVLEAAGSGLGKVIKVTVFLRDFATNFAPMNEVYVRRFAMPMPVR
jgi:enamine deaminase RidA (YjgF/YER057c/UK114 family)